MRVIPLNYSLAVSRAVLFIRVNSLELITFHSHLTFIPLKCKSFFRLSLKLRHCELPFRNLSSTPITRFFLAVTLRFFKIPSALRVTKRRELIYTYSLLFNFHLWIFNATACAVNCLSKAKIGLHFVCMGCDVPINTAAIEPLDLCRLVWFSLK